MGTPLALMHRVTMRKVVAGSAAALAVLALSSCSNTEPQASPEPLASSSIVSPNPTDSRVPAPVGKYTQTWTRPYDKTSCKAYQSVMTPQQRWVAAADMLSAARTSSGISELLPPDPLVDGFAEGIDMVCIKNPKFNIALAAVDLYTADLRFQQ